MSISTFSPGTGPGRYRRAVLRPLRELLVDLNAFLFPPACLACRTPLPARRPLLVCGDCRRRLVPVAGPTCLACRSLGRESAGFAAGRRHAGGACADPGHRGLLVYAAVQMVDPADRLVHALKFRDRPEVGGTLAVMIARRLRAEGAAAWDRVLPMPLHPTRQRARGYNQSREIAARLARSLRAELRDRDLVRARFTRPQADLDHAERGANVTGAFALRSRRRSADQGSPPQEGASCLLVDDVATTGHTLLAALAALKEAGPARTAAAVFALA